MQNFASSLFEDGYSDFVKSVLYRVKKLYAKGKHEKYYRILLDEEGKYCLRVSVLERYNDYSNNITVLLGLMSLHGQAKKTGEKLKIREFHITNPS